MNLHYINKNATPIIPQLYPKYDTKSTQLCEKFKTGWKILPIKWKIFYPVSKYFPIFKQSAQVVE